MTALSAQKFVVLVIRLGAPIFGQPAGFAETKQATRTTDGIVKVGAKR